MAAVGFYGLGLGVGALRPSSAGPPTPPPDPDPVPLYSIDFAAQPVASSFPSPWIHNQGPTRQHGIAVGGAYHVGATGETTSVVDVGETDVRVVTPIVLPAAGNVDAGVSLRNVSPTTGLFVGMVLRSGNDRVGVYLHSTTYTLLGEWNPAGLVRRATPYVLEVTVVGDVLTVRVDDVQRIAVTLTSSQMATLAGSTRHGLRSSNEAGGSRWQSFAVYAA